MSTEGLSTSAEGLICFLAVILISSSLQGPWASEAAAFGGAACMEMRSMRLQGVDTCTGSGPPDCTVTATLQGQVVGAVVVSVVSRLCEHEEMSRATKSPTLRMFAQTLAAILLRPAVSASTTFA